MRGLGIVVALWLFLNGLWPAVPFDIHSDHEGVTPSEAVDITVHVFGFIALVILVREALAAERQ